jgi:hypothetical protein
MIHANMHKAFCSLFVQQCNHAYKLIRAKVDYFYESTSTLSRKAEEDQNIHPDPFTAK